jgi:kynurenine formamidase
MTSMRIGNWGRWGDQDERGAANLANPETAVNAARLVRTGEVYSLGLVIQQRRFPVPHMRIPPLHLMAADGAAYLAGAKAEGGAEFADSYITMGTQVGTHLDALSHIWDDGLLYNGFSRAEVRTTTGARRLGIDKVGAVVTRGVLLDLPRYFGVSRLEFGQPVDVADLEGCLREQNVSIQPGDAVLLRTNWLSMFYEDEHRFESGEPGITVAAARYLTDHDIALVGADNLAVEVMPWDTSGPRKTAPAHLHLIRDHGVLMLELLDLEALAAAGATEFLFVVSPLRVKGAVGGPSNPLAIC